MATRKSKPTASKKAAKVGRSSAKAARQAGKTRAGANPLLGKWTTPFEMPPFDRVRDEHFMPAFDRAFADNVAEIEAIAKDPATPTFQNTIDVLERTGRSLERAASVFYNLAGTDTNETMQAKSSSVPSSGRWLAFPSAERARRRPSRASSRPQPDTGRRPTGASLGTLLLLPLQPSGEIRCEAKGVAGVRPLASNEDD